MKEGVITANVAAETYSAFEKRRRTGQGKSYLLPIRDIKSFQKYQFRTFSDPRENESF